jgi:hypothetical protein
MGTRAAVMTMENDLTDGMGISKAYIAEIELQKLQRQYRIMEGDRKAYSEESRLLIGKQRYNLY